MQICWRVLLLVAALSLLVGCGSDDSGEQTPTDTSTSSSSGGDASSSGGSSSGASSSSGADMSSGAVTYHGAVRSIVEANCLGCHVDGGVGPFSAEYDAAEWADGAPDWAILSTLAVAAGNMPPWMPDEECKRYVHERRLEPAEIEAFAAWARDGHQEGDPSGYAPPVDIGGVDLGEPSILTDANVDYAPNLNLPDDYHCLPLDVTFDQDTFVTAFDVLPGDREIVHHVILYLVEADAVAEMEALSAGEPGSPGYTCFGGPRAGNSRTLSGWVPGQQPAVMPEDSAVIIPAGSRIVMQVHYNTLGLPEGSAPTDRTEVAMWTQPAAPQYRIETVAFPNISIAIAPDDPESVHVQDFSLPVVGTIVGVLPHMHTLGTEIRVDIERTTGEEECLINIPEWDFNWQQTYMFEADSYVNISFGDIHRLLCVYDNSAANQPTVNGEKLDPRLVTWGEGTLDEMCLNYLVARLPYGTPSGSECPGFEACYDACPASDGACYLDCSIRSGGDCALCMGDVMSSCGGPLCPVPGIALVQCLDACTGDQVECITGDCAAEYETYFDCYEPHLLAGDCNEGTAACGVTY